MAALGGTELWQMDAAGLGKLYRRGEASPVEVAKACLDRIDRLNGAYGAFCLVDRQAALAAATASEIRWRAGAPLGPGDGIPTTIKDLVVVEGWPTRRGSHSTEADPPGAADAPAVALLRRAGAVLLGKTTTPEFGWKGVTDNPLGHVARNPWNPAMTAGGSSGGAAVAASLGMGVFHIGTDGGGSIRIPAGFSGIVGLKPSYGRVPAWPPSPFASVAHLGPMTRTVADAALMLTLISGEDPRDWQSLPADGTDYRIGLDRGVRGLKVALSPTLGYARVDLEVEAAIRSAADLLAEQGAIVEEADPGFADPAPIFEATWFPGAALLLAGMAPEHHERLDPGLREIAARGRSYDVVEVQRAAKERAEMAIGMQLFFQRYDLLLTPTLPIPAFAAGQEVALPAEQGRWIAWTPFSFPFNLTQQPAITVPAGLTSSGLPIGLQIVGPRYADARVLQAAQAFASARPMPHPPAWG